MTFGDVVLYAAIGIGGLLVALAVLAAIVLVVGGRSLASVNREDIA